MSKLTEHRNPASSDIHRMSTEEALRVFNLEDSKVAAAVADAIPKVAELVDGCVKRMQDGGRLIYVGAGTSGRLGVLDASEVPPTFGLPAGRVIGIIAGGPKATRESVEGAEDDRIAAERDLAELKISSADTVLGISASGDTPYVISATEFAQSKGCLTAALTSAPDGMLNEIAEIAICVETGAEVLAGSTRLKAGTSHKMVLNMLSTLVMIRLGYTTGNVMTNLAASNEKLKRRAAGIIRTESGISETEAAEILDEFEGDLPAAILSVRTGAPRDEIIDALRRSERLISEAEKLLKKKA